MTRQDILSFVRQYRWAVVATTSRTGQPQAAVVGFAASDSFELIFDTLDASRKIANLRHDNRIAAVIGWDDAQTVQIDGIADEPKGSELERLQKIYFARFPDGLDRRGWKGISYVRVRPAWVRYSDFRVDPPGIIELPSGDPTKLRRPDG
jgi:hypothetical protein